MKKSNRFVLGGLFLGALAAMNVSAAEKPGSLSTEIVMKDSTENSSLEWSDNSEAGKAEIIKQLVNVPCMAHLVENFKSASKDPLTLKAMNELKENVRFKFEFFTPFKTDGLAGWFELGLTVSVSLDNGNQKSEIYQVLSSEGFPQNDKYCTELNGNNAGMFGLPIAMEFWDRPIANALNPNGFIRLIQAAVQTRDHDPQNVQQIEQNRLRKELEEKLK